MKLSLKKSVFTQKTVPGSQKHPFDLRWICKICDKILQTPKQLQLHMNVHKTGFAITCEVCGKGLSSTTTYKNHMLIHKGEYPYECKICKKGFRKRDKLMDHTMRMHKEYYIVLKEAQAMEDASALRTRRGNNTNPANAKHKSSLISNL